MRGPPCRPCGRRRSCRIWEGTCRDTSRGTSCSRACRARRRRESRASRRRASARRRAARRRRRRDTRGRARSRRSGPCPPCWEFLSQTSRGRRSPRGARASACGRGAVPPWSRPELGPCATRRGRRREICTRSRNRRERPSTAPPRSSPRCRTAALVRGPRRRTRPRTRRARQPSETCSERRSAPSTAGALPPTSRSTPSGPRHTCPASAPGTTGAFARGCSRRPLSRSG
mmetsp:Transcript_362/g.1103  ORF Transcript_362/g.1103 Transcript_362/m.1103 type:complete len:230 (+) Transcript_362:1120-1809(+)